jgi:uncharacterized protein YgfB (UPF0149 family)
MGFLASLAAALLERFIKWFAIFLTNFVKEQKEIKKDDAKIGENLQDLKDAKTIEEQRRATENLLNG